ncbi:MAG: hypothetical protein WD404_03635 [Solirubrobacterales bacterium]
MRVLALTAFCFAVLIAAGCGSDSGTGSSENREEARQAAAREARLAAERAEARERRQAARRKERRQAAQQRARRERVEVEERERAEGEASAEPPAEADECDPNYEGACLDPNAPDYDCEGGSGDGPYYTGPVTVVGDDHHGLDSDGDGSGCE